MALGKEKLRPEVTEQESILNESEKVVYGALVPAMEAARINPENFKSYKTEMIQRDMEYTASRVAENARDDNPYKKHAEMAEAIVWHLTNTGQLMGPEAKSIVPTKYEDLTKGVDSIVRFEKKTGVSHLALAIDVTESVAEVGKKIEDILGNIEDGKLTDLEYFESRSSHGVGYQGKLDNLPKVVVASGRKSVGTIAERLAKLWSLSETAKTDPKTVEEVEKLKRAISKSQFKFKVLFEIKVQLEKYAEYAAENGHPEIVGPHKKALTIISELLDSDLSPERQAEVLKTIKEDPAVAAVYKKLEAGRTKPIVARPATPPKPKERWK